MGACRRDFLRMTGAAALGVAALSSCQGEKAMENDPLAELASMVDDLEPIGKSDFIARHDRARELMGELGIDALFLSGSTNLKYFSDISWGGGDRLFAMILPTVGDPVCVCPEFELPSLVEVLKYGEDDVRTWQEHEDPFRLSAEILGEMGIDRGTIAIDGGLPFWYYDHLAKAGGNARYLSADPVTIKLRSIKSPKEISLIRRATEISLKVHEVCLGSLREGMSEGELNSMYAEAHEKLGAHSPWGGGSFGPASSYVHGTTRKFNLEPGMVILADAGAKVHGYSSDVSRTTVFGEPSDEVKRAWETALKGQRAGIEAVKPGAACQDVDREIRRVLEENGYGPGYKNLGHRVGHGIGLNVHEHPYLVEGNTTPMEVGMTFAFDGALYVEGEFGIRFEDNVVVTQEGCEVFGNRVAVSMERLFG